MNPTHPPTPLGLPPMHTRPRAVARRGRVGSWVGSPDTFAATSLCGPRVPQLGRSALWLMLQLGTAPFYVPSLVLDVRRPDERLAFGGMCGTLNIPADVLAYALALPPNEFARRYGVAKPGAGAVVVCVSRAGRRAAWAAQVCLDAGINRLVGGGGRSVWGVVRWFERVCWAGGVPGGQGVRGGVLGRVVRRSAPFACACAWMGAGGWAWVQGNRGWMPPSTVTGCCGGTLVDGGCGRPTPPSLPPATHVRLVLGSFAAVWSSPPPGSTACVAGCCDSVVFYGWSAAYAGIVCTKHTYPLARPCSCSYVRVYVLSGGVCGWRLEPHVKPYRAYELVGYAGKGAHVHAS